MKRLNENQYTLIKFHLLVQRVSVQIWNLDLINAVVYGAENGGKWRALPRKFGNGHTRLYALEAIGLHDKKLIKISAPCLGIDNTSIKNHPDVAGALKKTPPSHRQIARRMEDKDGRQKFIGLPHMIVLD